MVQNIWTDAEEDCKLMARTKNIDWHIPVNTNNCVDWPGVTVAVLMDIREELRTLNRLLGCRNFVEVPLILQRIDTNTRRKARAKKEEKI